MHNRLITPESLSPSTGHVHPTATDYVTVQPPHPNPPPQGGRESYEAKGCLAPPPLLGKGLGGGGERLPDHSRPAISLVTPCYNEEAVLPELYQRCTRVLEQVTGGDYELILVNDGSTDTTWALICGLAQQDQHVVGVDLSRNFGHQRALTAGLSMARGHAVMVIDADLQDPPELLGEMLRLLNEGADVVYGQRLSRDSETRFKRWSAAIFYRLLLRLTDVAIPPDTGDFRLMRRSVVDALLAMPEYHRFIRGMVAWLGFRQVPIHYHREKRFAGVTKYPLRRMLHLATDAVTSFSIAPLRISTYFGFLFSLLALLSLFYILASWLFFNTAPGWSSLMSLTAIIGGIQLIAVGVMGEYLGRIYLEVKHRPNFIIREIVSQSEIDSQQVPSASDDSATLV